MRNQPERDQFSYSSSFKNEDKKYAGMHITLVHENSDQLSNRSYNFQKETAVEEMDWQTLKRETPTKKKRLNWKP